MGELLCPGEQRGPQTPRGPHNVTPPPIKGTFAHPHNHSTVYSEHLLYAKQQSHRCSAVPQAAGAIHVGIPGGHQCQGQVPERKGPGQLSLGGRRGRKLHALDEGDLGCPVGGGAVTGKGRQEDAGTVGEKGADEQTGWVTGSEGNSREGLPRTCGVWGPTDELPWETWERGTKASGGREEAYHPLGLSSSLRDLLSAFKGPDTQFKRCLLPGALLAALHFLCHSAPCEDSSGLFGGRRAQRLLGVRNTAQLLYGPGWPRRGLGVCPKVGPQAASWGVVVGGHGRALFGSFGESPLPQPAGPGDWGRGGPRAVPLAMFPVLCCTICWANAKLHLNPALLRIPPARVAWGPPSLF